MRTLLATALALLATLPLATPASALGEAAVQTGSVTITIEAQLPGGLWILCQDTATVTVVSAGDWGDVEFTLVASPNDCYQDAAVFHGYGAFDLGGFTLSGPAGAPTASGAMSGSFSYDFELTQHLQGTTLVTFDGTLGYPTRVF